MYALDPLTSSDGSTATAARPAPFAASVLDRMERLRVREADGLSPDDPPPVGAVAAHPAAQLRLTLQLLWHLRDVQSLGSGQYRITVPLSGCPTAPNASRELQRILEQMWVLYPTSDLSAATAVSVVLGPRDGEDGELDHGQLIIHLSVDPTADRRIDGSQMARHLRSALAQLAA